MGNFIFLLILCVTVILFFRTVLNSVHTQHSGSIPLEGPKKKVEITRPGHKTYEINGKFITALNYKNAVRKAAKS